MPSKHSEYSNVIECSLSPHITATNKIAAIRRPDERAAAALVQSARPRPAGIAAGAAGTGGHGDGFRSRGGGGKDGQFLCEVGGVAARAVGNGAGADQGFEFVAALVAGVFVDGHVQFLFRRAL